MDKKEFDELMYNTFGKRVKIHTKQGDDCSSVTSLDYPRSYEKEIRSIMGCAAIAGMDLRSDLKRNDVAAGLERSMQSYISLFDRKTEG